jgi:peptide/nickel transport system permease protein
MWLRHVRKHVCGLALTALLGGLAAATLVRLAPGFGEDARAFDPRLTEASIHSLQVARTAENNLLAFYWRYLRGLAHGELGVSRSLRRPVSELLAERGPVTLRLVGSGLAAGWALGLGVALVAAYRKRAVFELLSASVFSLILCLPAAVIGLVVLFARAAPWWAIALIVSPKVFSYSRNLLAEVYAAPHVLLAEAKGLSRNRILLWHILPAIAPELIALAGISVTVAFSAAIPIEAVCDIPGAGQLAWQAALGRDLPVLVSLTLLLAVATRAASAAADAAITAVRPEAA